MKKLLHIIYDVILANFVKFVGMTMIIIILLQIGSRTFMRVPFSWTEEASRFTFLWFCFMGSVVTLQKNMHLGIDYFYNKLGKKGKKIDDVVIQTLVIMFGLVVSFYGYKILGITGMQKSPVMRIPMSYVYAALPVTGMLYTLLGVSRLVEIFTGKEVIN